MDGEGGAPGEGVRRRLTEIEYVNWCFGQPYNIAVTVRLAGPITVDDVRGGVGGLCRRHPLLRVTTVLAPDGTPWLESDRVDPVPVRVVAAAGPQAASRVLDAEVATPFVMDHPADAVDRTTPPGPGATADGTADPSGPADPSRPPLLRVTVLDGGEPGGLDVVLCAQHVIADGLSLFFLVRDLVQLLRDPDTVPEPLDGPARWASVLPPDAARRMHRTPFAALTARTLLRAYRRLRFPLRPPAPFRPEVPAPGRSGAPDPVPVHSWQLTREQTTQLRQRCRREGVSVQSALCTAFLPVYAAVNTPVNLRGRLGVEVGESVGLYVGNAVVMRSYRSGRDFWWNARAFHRRLRRAMRDPFLMIRLCSPVVPRPLVHELVTGLMALIGRRRPLAVTNLGVLDGTGLTDGPDPTDSADLTEGTGRTEGTGTTGGTGGGGSSGRSGPTGRSARVVSFRAGMSGFADAAVLTAYTLDGELHLHLRGGAGRTAQATADDAARAADLLLTALGPTAPDGSRAVPGPST